jgi:hypothetical protein
MRVVGVTYIGELDSDFVIKRCDTVRAVVGKDQCFAWVSDYDWLIL